MQIDLDTLPDDPAALQQMLRDVVAAAQQQQTTMLQEKNGITVPAACNVTWVSYAGDEGGIICQLDAGTGTSTVFTSLTHLRFDPRLPLARDILTYQKHRVKRLRRQPQQGRASIST